MGSIIYWVEIRLIGHSSLASAPDMILLIRYSFE